ncbi:hypothetical protein E4T81_12030 [Barnesiella sp. WM24]|uniref:hypothetical protein n=1 Tax=Barnesiella sp. WM24 TaxID=2558278 RepID=UPI0010721DB9|nr:hypothetical protein [Barnesiella sp. WM24]TFU92311.1 hypothetical protein E4T81_12030 [Barnesiella sp. WM24]
MEAIQLNKETLVAVYGNCNAVGRKAIKEQIGEKLSEILPVTDRVKTIKDAIEELGEEHEAVKAYRAVEWSLRDLMPDIKAYFQLRIITAALNEGWEPQFVDGERRWYGWYDLISKEDYEALSDEEKSRCVGRSNYYAYASGGLVYSDAYFASSYSNYGSRLAFKSEKLAEYAAKQFIEIYADFCFIPEKNKA